VVLAEAVKSTSITSKRMEFALVRSIH
jgi:hypothetical protein